MPIRLSDAISPTSASCQWPNMGNEQTSHTRKRVLTTAIWHWFRWIQSHNATDTIRFMKYRSVPTLVAHWYFSFSLTSVDFTERLLCDCIQQGHALKWFIFRHERPLSDHIVPISYYFMGVYGLRSLGSADHVTAQSSTLSSLVLDVTWLQRSHKTYSLVLVGHVTFSDLEHWK